MYGKFVKGENFTVLKLQMLYPQSFQPINNTMWLTYWNCEYFIMNGWALQQKIQYAPYVYLTICATISGLHWLLFLTLPSWFPSFCHQLVWSSCSVMLLLGTGLGMAVLAMSMMLSIALLQIIAKIGVTMRALIYTVVIYHAYYTYIRMYSTSNFTVLCIFHLRT